MTPDLPRRSMPLAILAIVMAACATPVAQEVQQAGLLVQHGDGEQGTDCVSFQEQRISGEDLLMRSQFSAHLDQSNPMGALVCQIDGEGCAYPQGTCLCQCQGGGPCRYWAYFIRDSGENWVYAPVGARSRKLQDGDMDAWIWLESAGPDGAAITEGLKAVTFEDVCPQAD